MGSEGSSFSEGEQARLKSILDRAQRGEIPSMQLGERIDPRGKEFSDNPKLLGYAVRSGGSSFPERPVAVVEIDAGEKFGGGRGRQRVFMDEDSLAHTLEVAQSNKQGARLQTYSQILEGLQGKISEGADLGKPLGSVNDFKVSDGMGSASPAAKVSEVGPSDLGRTIASVKPFSM